jgi:acetyl-CoA carboxylase carboxyl transferase subunit alpha
MYSVIPPEGCASILWRDAKRKIEATEALKITAPDLLALKVIDEIIPEPLGGAHHDYEKAATIVGDVIERHLATLNAMAPAERLDARYQKFRQMGDVGLVTVSPA